MMKIMLLVMPVVVGRAGGLECAVWGGSRDTTQPRKQAMAHNCHELLQTEDAYGL